MRVAFHDWCGKGQAFAGALAAAGHDVIPVADLDASESVDVALLDSDHHAGLDRFARIVCYPHGANVLPLWDSRPPHPNLRMVLCHAYGHTQALASYGLAVPAVPVGWSYSPLAPFRPTLDVRRVLFGPVHPLSNGHIDPTLDALNRRILAELVALDVEVTVRYWTPDGKPPANLVDLDGPRVQWAAGGGLAYWDLDRADVVIAEGTLLMLAAARGRPTISFGQHVEPDRLPDQPTLTHWPQWSRLARHPLDIDDGPLADLLHQANTHDEAMVDWRDRFVGGPFDGPLVARLIETVCER